MQENLLEIQSKSPRRRAGSRLDRVLGILALVLLICLSIVGPSRAQSEWEQHDDLFSVSFPNENDGWACGRWGTILHTADGGQSWARQESGTTMTLSSVFFADAKTGWIVGNGGTILHTADGGNTWEQQKSPVPFFHMNVCFVSLREGWIVSEMTHILHTVDGGQTWDVQFSDEDYKLKAIAFADAKNGWAVGEYGFTYGTRDGGVTWEHQAGKWEFNDETGELETEIFLYDVTAIDAATAIAVGADGVVVKTVDGGSTWGKIQTGFGKVPFYGVVTQRDGTIVIGGKGLYAQSKDQGRTWQPISMQPSMEFGWLYEFGTRGNSEFVAVGAEGAIYRSGPNNPWKRVIY